MTKLTRKDKYFAIKEFLETGDCKVDLDVLVEFCDAEVAAMDRKAAKAKERAATKTAAADTLTDAVVAALDAETYKTIPEIVSVVAVEDPSATAAKVIYRLGKLVESGAVEKTTSKVADPTGGKRSVNSYRLVG